MSISRTKTSLVQEVNGKKYVVYPASYADVIFLVNEDGTSSKVNIQDKVKEIDRLIEANANEVETLKQFIKEKEHFKGVYPSLSELKKAHPFETLKAGDYAIISQIGEDDELMIFDSTENAWVRKGTITQEVSSVNGKTANELGQIVIYVEDIDGLREELNSFAKQKDLDRVEKNSVKYNRNWDSTISYHINDIVIYEKCIYIAISDDEIINIAPNLSGNTSWELIGVTTEYVNENGGKIDAIEVNGVNQTITNKKVNITTFTKTSELTNDSDFATNASVDEKLSNISAPDVSGQINTHNEDIAAHPFILSLLPTVTKVEE